MFKISIIIPFFNAEKFLPITINCLKEQTLKDIEIVLVNDGSTDNSLAICKRLVRDDKRFKIISQENHGVSAARNVGVKKSSAQYYLFLDADDVYEKDMCEAMYNTAKKKDADLVIFGIKIKEFDGSIHLISNNTLNGEWNKKKALEEFFSSKNMNIGVHTKLFSREIVKQIKFEEGKKINEDKFYLFQSILLSKKIVYDSQCKYLYIRRKGSASNTKYHPKYKDTIYFSKRILKTIQNEFSDLYLDAYKDLQVARLFTFRKLCKEKLNRQKYLEDYNEMKSEIKNSKLSFSKKCPLINKLEIIFIKCFGDLYYYLISLVYRNKN